LQRRLDAAFAFADFPTQRSIVQGGELAMGQAVRPDGDAASVQRPHPVPRQQARGARRQGTVMGQTLSRAGVTRRDETRGGQAELLQDRQGDFQIVGIAVIEGNRHGGPGGRAGGTTARRATRSVSLTTFASFASSAI